MLRYADNTATLGLISDNDESSYLAKIKDCINCRDDNLLLIFNFRKCDPSYTPVINGDSPVECEEVSSKVANYLGLITLTLTSKFQQSFYFLRLIKIFNINTLHLFYMSLVESIAV